MLLLIVIYLAFVSLGLPDSMLGSAWPVISTKWQLPLDGAGYVSLILVGSTIVSSFLSGQVIRKFGTAKVTIFSCGITGCSLLGYSIAPSYGWLILFSIPLGLGAGAVDAALNGYVAKHYKAHHMNWLHAFWGIGASLGPMIMSVFVLSSWQRGYRVVGFMQLSLFVIMLLTVSVWPKETHSVEKETEKPETIKLEGRYYAYLSFLIYCMTEFSVGLWSASYLVEIKTFDPTLAARAVAMFYAGITCGRMLSGFLSIRVRNKHLIFYGLFIGILSVIGVLVLKNPLMIVLSMTGIGVGLAPFYPSMMHETPKHFGEENASNIIGHQVGFAATGSAVMPPIIGFFLNHSSLTLLPFILLFALGVLCVCVLKLYKK